MDHVSSPTAHDDTVHVTECSRSKQSDRTVREGERGRKEEGKKQGERERVSREGESINGLFSANTMIVRIN